MRLIPLLFLAACTTTPAVDDDPAPPAGGETLQLAACAAGEGELVADWSVDNGHGAVSSLAMDPDGAVALAGADGTVKLWDITSGELDWSTDEVVDPGAAYGSELGGERLPLTALTFENSGVLLTGGDEQGVVSVWDPAAGFEIAAWTLGEQPITAVAHAFDGQLLAAADSSFGGNLKAWNLGGAPDELPLETALWFVNDLSLDEQNLVVAGDIYGIPAVEIRSAAFPTAVLGLAELRALNGTVSSAALRQDGTVLVAGTGFLALLDPAEVDPLEQALVVLDSGENWISVTLLDDEHFAAATEGGRIAVGTIADLSIRGSLDGPALSGFEAVPGDWQLASAGEDGILRLLGCEG